ncbi:Oidioi.mRNA.OKI2018_I69.chr1.g2002.t1.cds [Oikopleura dioica]|uniref:hydroxymethylbilane synthase n=1 Tax=Oikopleura dioica TaxID=34765 RepID=A0ABN7SPR0_OIKDI|nr:Oidioi.mRNA.OKI2018_I69.chr1.g2002.t1.cds [Oikopleura dioica]
MKLVAGSRKSELAMLQTNFVKALLQKANPELEIDIEGIVTKGDKVLDVALSKIGEKSLFTKELEIALQEGKVQFLVHSLKDMPTTLPEGMVLSTILERESPLDAVVIRKDLADKGIKSLDQLEKTALIGSSSLRRKAQLKRKYPDFKIESVRGNLNTRLKKLDNVDKSYEKEYSALILARAGLERMARQNDAFVGRLSETLEPSTCLYAVGQGALAIETMATDEKTIELLSSLSHEETTLRVVAERSFMKTLNGGCSAPVATESNITKDNVLELTGGVFSLDGSEAIVKTESVNLCPEKMAKVEYPSDFVGIVPCKIEKSKMYLAMKLGRELAEKLQKEGAMKILEEAREANQDPAPNSSPKKSCPLPAAKDFVKSLTS